MPKRSDFIVVGYELFDSTRAALLDGTISLIISHPMERFAREMIAPLIKTKATRRDGGAHRVMFPIDVYTPESV